MSAEAASLARSWEVGKYTATLTVPKVKPGAVASAVIEWDPHVPQHLTPDEIARYKAGRNAAIAALGLSALVIDV